MNLGKLYCTLIFTFLIANPGLIARPIVVGDTGLQLEPPTGYVELTSQHQPYYDVVKKRVSPGATLVAVYIPAAELDNATAGLPPAMANMMLVESRDTASNLICSPQQFEELKRVLINGNTAMVEKQNSLTATPTLRIDPPYRNVDGALTYTGSRVVNIRRTAPGGQATIYFVSGVVNAKGKLLFCQAGSGSADMEASKKLVDGWTDAVMVANASPPISSVPWRPEMQNKSTAYYIGYFTAMFGIPVFIVALILRSARKKPALK